MGRQVELDVLFGQRMKEVRELRGWSQNQLAKRVGCYQSALSKIEAGTRTVSLTEAVLISGALMVPLDDMVSGSPLKVVTVR